MELPPSREAASFVATRELPNILRNKKLHYRVHKSPPLVRIPSHINPVHNICPMPLTSILILSTFLRIGVHSGLLAFPPITYIYSSSHSCYTHWQSHPPLLDHSNWTSRRAQVIEPLITQLSRIHCHSITPRCNDILLSILFSDTLSPCFSLNATDQVSHPYRTRGKIRFSDLLKNLQSLL
jgi:hypothetical protein